MRVIEDTSRQEESAVLRGAFDKQGLKRMPASAAFRAQFFAAAQTARDHLSATLVKRELVERVMRMLADYRLERASK